MTNQILKILIALVIPVFLLSAFTYDSSENKNESELITEDIVTENCFSFLEMPIGFEEASEVETIAFFDNYNRELEIQLVESFQVKQYLKHINKLDNVIEDMKAGSLFSEVNLTNYLTEKEISNMDSFEVNAEVSNSSSMSCHDTMEYCYSRNCNGKSKYQIWWSCYYQWYYKICSNTCGSGPR